MGRGSTQSQHLVQTEVPPKVLQEWLERWSAWHGVAGVMKVSLRPNTAGNDLLEFAVRTADGETCANVVFASIKDRRGSSILSVRDQNNFLVALRNKLLMTVVLVFLLHRYKVDSVHFVTPTDDNRRQAEGMRSQGIFESVNTEIGAIIVAEVNKSRVKALAAADRVALEALIRGAASSPGSPAA